MARSDNYDPVTNETDIYYQYQADAILQESVTILPAAGSSNITTVIGGGGGSVTGPTITVDGGVTGYDFVAAGTTITQTLTSASAVKTSLGIVTYLPNLTPASVAANISAEESFAVAGLTTNDTVFVDIPSLTAGTGLVGARVSAANTLTLAFANFTAGALTPAAGVYRVGAIRA